MPNAVFALYSESGYAAEPKQATKTDLISGEDGKIDLGGLAYEKYYLVETAAPAGYSMLSAPVEITVAASGVTYTQSDSSLSPSGNGITFDETTKTYTLTVTNTPGVELPSTGGMGAAAFTVTGGAMALLALALLLKRRREQMN